MKKLILFLAFIVAAKSTQAQNARWYDHAWVVDLYNGNTMSHNLVPLWYDSTVLQTNVQGDTVPIQYLSAAQVTDPIYFTLFNDPNIFPPSTLHLHTWDPYPYFIDSISFAGVYVKNLNRPNTIVDTLIISVSPYNYGKMIAFNSQLDTTDDWVSYYVSQPNDSLFGYTIFNVDSFNRASDESGRVIWKIPLDSTMRQVTTGTLADVDTFVVAVPGSCTIPAGHGFATTVTFKSGDIVANPYVDMFTDYHHFYFLSGEAFGQGQVMPYYYYTMADRNASNLMRSGDTTAYYPSVFLERGNIEFAPEFHSIAGHVNCPSCPVSVKEVPSHFTNIIAYPSPASKEVNISFTTESNGNAVVTITDILGQVMSKKELGAVKANTKTNAILSTKELAGGIYFYTVEANGQKSAGRFVVAH